MKIFSRQEVELPLWDDFSRPLRELVMRDKNATVTINLGDGHVTFTAEEWNWVLAAAWVGQHTVSRVELDALMGTNP